MRVKGLIPLVTVLLAFGATRSNADTLLVPQQYATIQSAVNAAQPGDTVLVFPNSGSDPDYHENVVINTADIKVTGNGAVLDGAPLSTNPGNGISVYASGVKISHLTVQNYTYAPGGVPVLTSGIYMNAVNDIVSSCTLQNDTDGVYVDSQATGAEVDKNTVASAQDFGIEFIAPGTAAFNTITGPPSASGSVGSGIDAQYGGMDIHGNNISGGFIGISLTTGTSMTVPPGPPASTVAGNRIAGTSDSGIYCNNSESVTFLVNTATTCGYFGVEVNASDLITVEGTLANGNLAGVVLENGTTSSLVRGNIAKSNSFYGFWADSSTYGNTFTLDIGQGNAVEDAEDDTGPPVLNTWTHDLFTNTYPAGLGS